MADTGYGTAGPIAASEALPKARRASQNDAMEPEANDRLVRAARELLRWDQTRLAKAAGVGIATIRRFETGATIGDKTIAKIAGALREAGVAFVGAGAPPRDIVEGVALTASGRPLEGPKGAGPKPSAHVGRARSTHDAASTRAAPGSAPSAQARRKRRPSTKID